MTINVLYKTNATATGGRDGKSIVEDGILSFNMSTPKELGGAGGSGNNPEQLFAAAYASCFITSMKAVSGTVGVKVPDDAKLQAHVGVGPRSEGGLGFEITLDIYLPGVAKDDAQKLVDTAHTVCPFSNATRNNVNVKLNII